MSGNGGTSLTADDFKSADGAIQWAELGKTALTSVWLAWGSFVAGVLELVFGLLSSGIETLYGAYATAAGIPFENWTGLIESAWLGAGRSLGELGLVAWVVGALVVAAFFVLVARAFGLLSEGVTP